MPTSLLDSCNNFDPHSLASTQLLDASLMNVSYPETIVPEQASATMNDIVENITTCGNCGGTNNVMETISFLFSDVEKASFYKALAEAIVSRPALYKELLNRSAFVGEVRRAAELVSRIRTDNREDVSIRLRSIRRRSLLMMYCPTGRVYLRRLLSTET